MDGHEVHDLHSLFMEEVERPLLETVLRHTHGNQTLAAKLLGMSRSTLRKRMAVYDINEGS
jgi:Fis family transcriptional regulator